tara:strand:+ start:7517 stop:8311 length:795 start_codon:yes stop_codon:yes gene_type:complete
MKIVKKIFKFFILCFDRIKSITKTKKYYTDKQNFYFGKIGLDRNKALTKINNLNLNFDQNNYGMFSEHITLFSAISLKKKILNILEIGTFDGSNAHIMSKIFDEAKIETIDLDEKNEMFSELYNRDKKSVLKNLYSKREKYFENLEKVEFKKLNSMELIYRDTKNFFDIIWVDGHHGNPYVTVDIMNSLKLIKDNGLILCDDVLTSEYISSYDPYNSNASYFMLNALKKNNFIKFDLIYKRLSKRINDNRFSKKYIAVIKKLSK